MMSFAKSMFSIGALAAAFTLVSSQQAEARYGFGLRHGLVRSVVAPRSAVHITHYPVSRARVGVVAPRVVVPRVPTYVVPAPVIRPVLPYGVPSYYGLGYWHY